MIGCQQKGKPYEDPVKKAAFRQKGRAPVGKEKDEQRRGKKQQMIPKRTAPIPPQEAEPGPGQPAPGAGHPKEVVDRAAKKTVQSQQAEDSQMDPKEFECSWLDSRFDV